MARILSHHRYSKQWYQRDGITTAFALLIILLGYFSILLFGFQPPMSLRLISVLVLGLGVSADIFSTHQVFSVKRRYDTQGFPFDVRESNPLLPEAPSLRDLVWGKPTLLAVASGLVTFFIPLAGWAAAGALFTASLNNHRNYKQSLYELELLAQMTMKE